VDQTWTWSERRGEQAGGGEAVPLARSTAPKVALAARRTAGAGRRRPGEGSGGRLPDGEQRLRRPSGSGSGKQGSGGDR